MYFEIENTPENIKKTRKKPVAHDDFEEECPRLVLAPFTKPPQVIFDNVLIGTKCTKELEVFNPLKQAQQIRLSKSLPPGLVIELPEDTLLIEPETCYCVTMVWSPTQPTSLRETIRFTNENRGRYDVNVVLKSVIKAKGKNNQPKFKTSPGKIKKKTGKRSPVAIYKKKIEAYCNTMSVKQTVNVVQSTQYKIINHTKKDNIYPHNEYLVDSDFEKCPFGSPSSVNFDLSEVFSNIPCSQKNVLHDTYDKPSKATEEEKSHTVPKNVLQPSNKQDFSATDLFDNLTFTPLKSVPKKKDKLDKGPKIIISVNSESDFDDSLDVKGANKENQNHSFLCVTSSQQTSNWTVVNDPTHDDGTHVQMITNKKIPNTSSPKDLNSPNFSINTDFSRISDSSFLPQLVSTERKIGSKIYNETHDIDESNINAKVNSDTYTKESPNTPYDYIANRLYHVAPFMKDQPKICRQALFKDQQNVRENYDRHLAPPAHFPWQNDLHANMKSPPRSMSPPLQSIPEESIQLSQTQNLDKTDTHVATFTINRTFDKSCNQSIDRQSSWSKRAVRAEPVVWKKPAPITKKQPKPKIKPKESCDKSNPTIEVNKSVNQSSCLNYIEDVYSQSFTVDPFLSATYFYDKDAVESFEKEFKRWLNCILTPPSDLDSNIEQQIDVGKAWIENRNKEVPLAPTKEQVCSAYHNSHRLESLRRSARTMLRSPEIEQVFVKLNAQIEKKLITVRTDRNLHLDIGLQKGIMEILLSYNPLWLRIALEAIYGVVLPLKSNNDIEGLTSFIVQRMFKNPNLKNKHSKSSAPNMLLPAYMEAIKKFTLKKFFILVFFLDQAKQKKLIAHDPCLFRRNAICKESKEIIIRFTRELIAGIGDITKHLRPLGYVVSHKQSYLDEYQYAVNNVAVDIRDGVRLTKVMEIILMRRGLLHQLRTPAISRLQKIHNVQVALNALKEANFVIVGDISATDIADGHREKTLSLLWQLIHVFRAPLFEQAANVIQIWWRKKYKVIVEKRREEERKLAKLNSASSIIQYWWRRVQYNRMVKYEMHRVTVATIVIQKYCRMWLCRHRLKKLKSSVTKISEWYRSMKMIREAKEMLLIMRLKREEVRHKSATVIQTCFRRWLCVTQYEKVKIIIIYVQSCVRRYLAQKQYSFLRKSTIYVQRKYRSKLLMKREIQNLREKINCAVQIQSYYKMYRQRKYYKELKKAVHTVETYYRALAVMRNDRTYYLKLKWVTFKIQAAFRRRKMHREYIKQREIIINVQRKIRANQVMKRHRMEFIKTRNATIVIQRHIKAHRAMLNARKNYINIRNSVIIIQRYYRAYLQKKIQRSKYLLLQKSVIQIQTLYRSLISMRYERAAYLKLKNAVITVQRRYRASVLMKNLKNKYQEIKKAVLVIQTRYRSLIKMREQRLKYVKLKTSCIAIQNAYRAYLIGKQQRQVYLEERESAIKIQNWYRSLKMGKQVREQYAKIKNACITIQKIYKAYITGKKQREDYIKLKNAAVCIQNYYRGYLLTKTISKEFLKVRKSTIKIQQFYRSWRETKIQRQSYLRIRQAAVLIQTQFRQHVITKTTRENYLRLKSATICIQQRYRNIKAMRRDREIYSNIKRCAINIQRRYRALQTMKNCRKEYVQQREAIINLQKRYKALYLMKQERNKYLRLLQACKTIQTYYRDYRKTIEQRRTYLEMKYITIKLQQRYRAVISMRKQRRSYLNLRSAAIILQRRYRAHQMMLKEKIHYNKIVISCITIQKFYKARLTGIKQRENYLKLKSATLIIQRRYREYRETKNMRRYYIQLRTITISIQRHIRIRNEIRRVARKKSVDKIQNWYKSIKRRNECRNKFIEIRRNVIIVQSIVRAFICRKRYLALQKAAITIQRYFRYYKLARAEREKYIKMKTSMIKLQAHVRKFIERKRYVKLRATILTIQAVYRFKKYKTFISERREKAALCIQKNVRRYLLQSKFNRFREKVIFIQKQWRLKLFTRLLRCEFLQKRRLMLKLQAAARGYLARKEFEHRKTVLIKLKEEQRQNWAASKIQALFRGHKARKASSSRAAEMRRRWRNGGLESSQESLKERHEDALEVLRKWSDIETLIRAFKSLELLTEVFPMMYDNNASSVVRRVHVYMSVMNRSIPSVEVLKSGASISVNLARYKTTGPKIYARDRITPVLKLMLRFSNTETQLFCILATFIWLFSKYDEIKKDLTEFLHMPENHKMMLTINRNINRMKRMACNTRNKFNTPQPSRFVSHEVNQSLRDSENISMCGYNSDNSYSLPALEPDYGILRVDKPRYFEDTQHAINSLFDVYRL